jgi:hypothetical protein
MPAGAADRLEKQMTTLAGWLATDSRGPSSIYLASDSRISWQTPDQRWDAARKLFACRHSADLFGYCGDALFPSQTLGQVTEIADHHLLFDPVAPASARHERVVQMVAGSIAQRQRAVASDFTFVHVGRDQSGMASSFKVWCTTCTSGGEIRDGLLAAIEASDPGPSRRLLALGSGADAYIAETIRWDASAQGKTSRAYFTALCDVVAREDDPASGGIPQLVGLYRSGNGRAFGIIHGGRRFFHGLPLAEMDTYGSIEWRDDAFQRIDGKTLKLVKRGQRQVRPSLPEL